jgi:hypothetical protein
MDFVFRARVAELHSIEARQHSSSPSLILHSNKTALHVVCATSFSAFTKFCLENGGCMWSAKKLRQNLVSGDEE